MNQTKTDEKTPVALRFKERVTCANCGVKHSSAPAGSKTTEDDEISGVWFNCECTTTILTLWSNIDVECLECFDKEFDGNGDDCIECCYSKHLHEYHDNYCANCGDFVTGSHNIKG